MEVFLVHSPKRYWSDYPLLSRQFGVQFTNIQETSGEIGSSQAQKAYERNVFNLHTFQCSVNRYLMSSWLLFYCSCNFHQVLWRESYGRCMHGGVMDCGSDWGTGKPRSSRIHCICLRDNTRRKGMNLLPSAMGKFNRQCLSVCQIKVITFLDTL